MFTACYYGYCEYLIVCSAWFRKIPRFSLWHVAHVGHNVFKWSSKIQFHLQSYCRCGVCSENMKRKYCNVLLSRLSLNPCAFQPTHYIWATKAMNYRCFYNLVLISATLQISVERLVCCKLELAWALHISVYKKMSKERKSYAPKTSTQWLLLIVFVLNSAMNSINSRCHDNRAIL